MKLDLILDFFFPKTCSHCGIIEDYLCEDCVNSIKKIKPESFLTRKPSLDWEVEIEKKNLTSLEKVYYFYEYDNIIHSLITDIKYRFYWSRIPQIAEMIINSYEFNTIDFDEIDLITFVPISKKRHSYRGFNHSEKFAKFIAQSLDKEFLQVLIKQNETIAQADLNREGRLKNLKNSFAIFDEFEKVFDEIEIKENSKILIIDDICTTGSTLEECAKTIRERFPEMKVYGLCLARA